MADTTQDLVATNYDTSDMTITANMTNKEVRELKAAASEAAERERRSKWATRADVVYHFFSYRYFDRPTTCLDLLNFSDADVDSFNLLTNKTRGFDDWHICAEYLKKMDDATPETNTHRRRLIHKVRTFNKTQPPHFRFYLQNLTEDDIAYVQALCEQEKATGLDEGSEMKLIWATSCVEDKIPVGLQGIVGNAAVESIEDAIEKCLDEHRQKLQEKVHEFAAKKAEEHAENVAVIQDELTKQFKRLAKNGGEKESINGIENASPKNGSGKESVKVVENSSPNNFLKLN